MLYLCRRIFFMKILLIFLFFLPFLASAQSLSEIEFGTDSTFDVMTWNIEHFPKNGTITTDSIAKIVISLQADIIACQEIDDTVLFNNMVSSIPNYAVLYDPNNFEGLAYIYNTTTVQITDNYSIYTSGAYWRPFPRAPYLLKATYKNKDFVLINNHLKCCGNGLLDQNDIDDEENRRYEACLILASYISSSFPSANVILLGDLNDELTDASVHNVFQPFFDLPNEYTIVDQNIATGSSSNWSYPAWPSHLDHIIITNELFQSFNHLNTSVSTIRIDDYLPNGFSDYDADISDHRPVGLKLFLDSNILSTSEFKAAQYFHLFPNPSSSFVNIFLNAELFNFSIIVSNIYGQPIRSYTLFGTTPKIQINVSDMAPGVYYITAQKGHLILETKKICVQ